MGQSDREWLVYERYLIHILKELRRSDGKETRRETSMFAESKHSSTTLHMRGWR